LIEPQIGRHLVVPAAGGMQSLADIADALRQQTFDVHVDVFTINSKFDFTGFNIMEDLCQRFLYQFSVRLSNDALPAEHPGMGYTPPDILFIQPLIDFNRLIESLSRRTLLL
jgi:hypothetical protein